jgi:hypothetical protein
MRSSKYLPIWCSVAILAGLLIISSSAAQDATPSPDPSLPPPDH